MKAVILLYSFNHFSLKIIKYYLQSHLQQRPLMVFGYRCVSLSNDKATPLGVFLPGGTCSHFELHPLEDTVHVLTLNFSPDVHKQTQCMPDSCLSVLSLKQKYSCLDSICSAKQTLTLHLTFISTSLNMNPSISRSD